MRRALAIAALVVSASAAAQTFYPYWYLPWRMFSTPADPFKYYVDARAQNPAGLTLSDVTAATTRAWKTWDDVSCASPAFQALGPTGAFITDPRDPYDVFNVSTVWVQSDQDPYYGFVLGQDITSSAFSLNYAGILEQCDIYMNAVNRTWSTQATTPAGQVDVESMVLHESGHCLGMDDVLGTYPQQFVMHPISPIGYAKRALDAYDFNGFCERNPATGAQSAPCFADGGCGSGMSGLKCVRPPAADGGLDKPVCTIGCPTGQNFQCLFPYTCQSSTFFSPSFNGACLPTSNNVTQVGRACQFNTDCGSSVGICFNQTTLPSGFPEWQAGYCSQNCAAGQPPCPAGSTCLDVGAGTLRCLKECRFGAGDCRPGYTCVHLGTTGTAGVCITACHGDNDCGTTAICRVCDGTCLDKQKPGGMIGDLCSTANDCGAGQSCAKFSGTSTTRLCTQNCAKACTACPAGSKCHAVGERGELYCLRDCSVGTCPPGLQCSNLPGGRGCMPPCTSDVECAVGNRCIFGECKNPSATDAGCPLCPNESDAGDTRPTDGAPRDGGSGGGPGSGGCGCSGHAGGSAPWLLGFLVFGFWFLVRRKD